MIIVEYQGKKPRIAEGVFIAPTAVLIGDVSVGEGSSIWYGTVLRADFGKITIGKNTSIQDNVVIHMTPGGETKIGDNCTIAHGVVLHTATIGDGSVVGMNAVLLDNCVVGDQCMIAAGSVVTSGSSIPGRHLAAGSPATPKKEISGEALNWVTASSMAYSHLAKTYLDQGLDR